MDGSVEAEKPKRKSIQYISEIKGGEMAPKFEFLNRDQVRSAIFNILSLEPGLIELSADKALAELKTVYLDAHKVRQEQKEQETAFAGTASTFLHGLFDSLGKNSEQVDVIARYYLLSTNKGQIPTKEAVEGIKAPLMDFAKLDASGTFSLPQGPVRTIRRLKTADGTAIVEAPSKPRKTRAKGAGKAQAAGETYTKDDVNKLAEKMDKGKEYTKDDLAKYLKASNKNAPSFTAKIQAMVQAGDLKTNGKEKVGKRWLLG